jgi:putative SOS response-associated peptidase YedK
MCGRMTLTRKELSEVADALGAEVEPELVETYRPRYNLPPTDPHLVVVSAGAARRLQSARWCFGPSRLINARAETAPTNGLFKGAFAERRCLVPADGFYEWIGGKGQRQPVWFHAHPGELFTFAGLLDRGGGFVVLTVAANDEVRPVHDRMPALLFGAARDAWLARPDAALLRPAPPGHLERSLASPRVNSVANDDPDCLRPPDQLPLW